MRRRPAQRAAYPSWAAPAPALLAEALVKLDRLLADWDQLCRDIDAGGPGLAAGAGGPAARVRAALIEARDALTEWHTAIELHASAYGAGDDTVRPHELEALADSDGRCRQRLEEAAARLPCEGLQPWLAERDPDGEPLPVMASALGGDAEALRQRLGDAPAHVVADVLARYPAVAHVLSEPASSGPPMPELAGARPRGPTASGDHGRTLRRVVGVRAALSGVDPDTVRRWGMLWPQAFGGMDGAPLAVRFEANRLLLRHALAELAAADRWHDAREAGFHGEPRSRLGAMRRRFRLAWASREALAGLYSPPWVGETLARSDARARIRLIQSLLHAPQQTPTRSPSHDDCGAAPAVPPGETTYSVRRQILLFDPAGRGRLAELRGRIGAWTQHVAVLVPGTGTAMRGFHMPAQFAADLVRADQHGATAALAWMGCELPLAYGSESPLARFARAGAEPLRDVVEALGLPDSVDVTVIGHSYGGVIVGAAERVGVRADRVVHLASPGAGPGIRGVEDYPDRDPLGRTRTVRRWYLIAPGDPVNWARRVDRVRRSARGLPALPSLDLGVDPTRLVGIEQLDAGVWDADSGRFRRGMPVAGFTAHTAVTNPATSAFRRVAEVVRGEFPA